MLRPHWRAALARRFCTVLLSNAGSCDSVPLRLFSRAICGTQPRRQSHMVKNLEKQLKNKNVPVVALKQATREYHMFLLSFFGLEMIALGIALFLSLHRSLFSSMFGTQLRSLAYVVERFRNGSAGPQKPNSKNGKALVQCRLDPGQSLGSFYMLFHTT